MGVCRCGQIFVAVTLTDTRIMAGGDFFAAKGVGLLHQHAPFDVGIAKHAGVWRAALHVFLHKIADDFLLEHFPEVDDVVLKSHFFRQMFGFHDGFHAAAAFFLGQAMLLDGVEGAEGDAYQLTALIQQPHGADRTVNTSAHGH